MSPREDKHARFFLSVAREAARSATCLRLQVGSVLVRDERVVSIGYNGAPAGAPTCLEAGCELATVDGRPHCHRAIHADQNALLNLAAGTGGARGCALYTTHAPCYACAKMLVAAGVVKVVFGSEYDDPRTKRFLQEAGVERVRLSV